MSHDEIIINCDPCFEINTITRAITCNSGKACLVQGDRNSERFGFKMPRFVEGHDMSKVSKVEVHHTNIDKETKNEISDVYRVKDLKVCEDDENKIEFSWLVSSTATKYAGKLEFSISFSCFEEGSINPEYVWGTTDFLGTNISPRRNNTNKAIEENPDLAEGITQELREYVDENTSNIIVNKVESSIISDSVEAPLRSIKIFGKTTQNGIPTPENPIKLVNVGDSGNLSVVCGQNILPQPYNTPSSSRYTKNGDGSITVDIKHEDGLVYFTLYEGSPLSSEVAKIALLGQYHNMVIYCKILDNEDNELYFENSPSALTIDFREYPSDAKVKIGIRNNVKPYNASGTVYPVYMSDFSECSVTIAPLRSVVGTNIRDEIDTARKVRVQRVGREILTKAERTSISSGDVYCACTVANFPRYGKVCSDRYSRDTDSVIPSNNQISGAQYSIYIGDSRFTDIDKANEILAKEKPEVLYELAEPIETPLSDEEIEAYKALYTYYPKTFIYNSENTDIEVGYVADTKNYIDNKFAELTQAIIAVGGMNNV